MEFLLISGKTFTPSNKPFLSSYVRDTITSGGAEKAINPLGRGQVTSVRFLKVKYN